MENPQRSDAVGRACGSRMARFGHVHGRFLKRTQRSYMANAAVYCPWVSCHWLVTFGGRCRRQGARPTLHRWCRWRRDQRRRLMRRRAGMARSAAVCRSATGHQVVRSARTCRVTTEFRLGVAGQSWRPPGRLSLYQSTTQTVFYVRRIGMFSSVVCIILLPEVGSNLVTCN